MNDVLSLVRALFEMLAALGVVLSPFLLAWLKARIRDEVQPVCDRIDALEDFRGLTEFKLTQYASTLRDVPRMTVLMEKHEETASRTSVALDALNRTLAAVSERLARIEEHVKLRGDR